MAERRARNPLSPTKLPQPQYEAEMWDHLKTREGMANRIYTDGKGIPTMGVGVALAVQGRDGKYVLRNPEEIGAEISGDKNTPYRFKPEEWQRLEQTVGKLNDPNLEKKIKEAEAKKLIPPLIPGKDAPENNKFGFSLSDERMKSQAFDKLPEYREAALKTVKQEALKRGWSEQDASAYVDQLRNSRQEGALTSMRYNGVAAPKASGAMVDGDRATMRKEILYGSNPSSNGNSQGGIANRRRDEADMATGNPAGWTPEEQAKWRGYEGTPQAQDYRRQFPDAFKDRPGTPAPSAPSSGQEGNAVVERMKTTPPMQVGKPPAPLPTASEWPKVDSSAFPAAQDAPKPEEPGWWDKAKEFIPSLVSPAHGGTLPGANGMTPPASTENGLVAVTEEARRYMTDDQKRLLDMSAAPIANPGQAALLKPVEKLTQPEMMDMINSAQGDYRGWRSGDPLKAHTYEKVQDWHTAMYGDAPQGNDGGKPIDPMPIRAIPDQSAPHVTPQGEDLWQATGRIGKQVVEVGQAQGMGNAVTSLQRGLNMLNAANPLPDRSPAYAPYTKLGQIAEDGAYGPQTDFALKHATARLGPNKVEDGFALGRFNTFARDAQRGGNPEGLENATHGAFGSLFRDPADSKAPKVEGGVLQETLNDLGSRSHDDWEPLKVDNWIGPKTTDAFGLKTEDADSFTSAFGRGLGLL